MTHAPTPPDHPLSATALLAHLLEEARYVDAFDTMEREVDNPDPTVFHQAALAAAGTGDGARDVAPPVATLDRGQGRGAT